MFVGRRRCRASDGWVLDRGAHNDLRLIASLCVSLALSSVATLCCDVIVLCDLAPSRGRDWRLSYRPELCDCALVELAT